MSKHNFWKGTNSLKHNLATTISCLISPVILRLKVADRDEASTTSNCKFVLQRWPLDEGGSSVNPEDDQRGLPHPLLLGPHIGITVCSACHYTVTFGSPVNTWRKKGKDIIFTVWLVQQQSNKSYSRKWNITYVLKIYIFCQGFHSLQQYCRKQQRQNIK